MKISNKKAWIFMFIGLLFALFLHEKNLYPDATLFDTVRITLLRFFLITLPIVLGFQVIKQKKFNITKIIFFILWLILIPYTIYSIVEIRHVAEICRLPVNTLYTEICIDKIWVLIPIFIYSFAGMIAFVFSAIQVSSSIFPISIKKQCFILLLCAYASFASVFGLYTRLNVWDAIMHPTSAVELFIKTLSLPGFVSNFFILTLFFVGILFVVNRIIRHAGEFMYKQ